MARTEDRPELVVRHTRTTTRHSKPYARNPKAPAQPVVQAQEGGLFSRLKGYADYAISSLPWVANLAANGEDLPIDSGMLDFQ
jgi:hypothetical protein